MISTLPRPEANIRLIVHTYDNDCPPQMVKDNFYNKIEVYIENA